MAKKEYPLVTMRIMTYNHENYIREALMGAFSQTYSPLEIIISDDNSKDNTFQIIKQIVADYKGNHIIKVNKNNINLGISEHLNKIMKMSSGELLIGAAGDDISFPNRVETIVNIWLEGDGKYKSFFSNAIKIDERSNSLGIYFKEIPLFANKLNDFIFDKRKIKRKIFEPCVWQLGATQAFEKSLFEIYGRGNAKALQEDGVYAFRALLQGEVFYISEPLIKYRIHSSSISNLGTPNSLKKFKKTQKYYTLTQLNDAKLTNYSNKKLLKKLYFYYLISYFEGILYSIPFYSNIVFYMKKIVKRIIK